MSAGSGLEPLALIARSLSPAAVVIWLALTTGLALIPSGKPGSRRALRGRRVIEPAMLAILVFMVAGVWHQATGEFISFGRAWPSAIAMGFAFSLVFVVFVNLQERISIGLSLFLLIFGAIPGSAFFALVFFALPWMLRREFGLFGF